MIATAFGIDPWFIVKIFVMIGLGVYLVFALVVVRQVSTMINTLEIGLENLIRAISIGHLLFSIGVFILALIIL